MRKSSLVVALTLLLNAGALQATDLQEAYEMAVGSDPLLREADANRMATSEAYPQARSALLPQFTGFMSQSTGTSKGSQVFQQDVNGVIQNVNSTFDQDNNQDQNWQLQIQQTVFRWDQLVGLKQSEKQVMQADIDYQVAQQDLMVRVAEAYFNVLAAQDTLDAEVANKESTQRQLEQAEKRFEVGLIAITDVLEAQAAYDLAVATDIGARRALSTAREQLREITGAYLEELQSPGDALPLVNPDPEDPDTWVTQAIKDNLSLNSSRLGAQVAKDQIKINKSGHMPTLDLVATRSQFTRDADRGNNGAPKQIADSRNQTNSLALQLNVPIYSGGFTSSQVRQAVYQHRAARERVERVARETERLTRDSYSAVISQIARVRALLRAVESNEKALQASEAGFEVGTRTTVDVLNARQELFRARTDYARTRYDYIVNVLRLKQAAGTLSDQDMLEVNSWLTR